MQDTSNRAPFDIRFAFDKSCREALARLTAGAIHEIQRATDEALRLAPATDRKATQDYDQRLREALASFRSISGGLDFRILRLVCHGCGLKNDGSYVILSDPDATDKLLKTVAVYSDDPRRLRRLYHGLLRSYLDLDRYAAGFENARIGNEALRRFLEARFAAIVTIEPKPDWVTALERYPEVLSTAPGLRFANGLLGEQQAEFSDAAQRLGLTGDAWLAAEVLRSAIQSAVASDHQTFSAYLLRLLKLADEPRFALLRDEVLAGLVIRYGKLPSPAPHATLRDALVLAWKNPWLPRNASAWGRVPDKVREMVAGWLKLELIHQFFEVLAGDGRQDRSRFEFWREYHTHMDDVWFALGSKAYRSTSPDMTKLRQALDGRLLELTARSDDNNAFVMCMGDIAVVEFSKTNNIACVYSREDLPLDGTRSRIAIDDLKNSPKRRRKWVHARRGSTTWQELFARELNDFLVPGYSRKLPQKWAISSADSGLMRSDSVPPGGFGLFSQQSGIPIDDHRPVGGNLWFLTNDANPEINRQLTAWGFNYSPGRGWWRSH